MTNEERKKAIDIFIKRAKCRATSIDNIIEGIGIKCGETACEECPLYYDDNELYEAERIALKALKQEPCEDAISRKEAYEQINCWIGSGEYKYTNATDYLTKRVANLSSVTPKLSESEDAISRQIASDYVQSHIQELNTGYGDLNAHTNRILRMIVEYIEKMPSVTPTQNWIPVSERMPEKEYENYLVSTKEGDVDIGTYDREKGWSMCDANGFYFPQYKGIEIVAWMPLPEHYKESEQHG